MTNISIEAQIARAALLTNFEDYLIKQRGLSPRTIYHTLRFANRFLDHCFGARTIELSGLRAANVIGFLQHLLTGIPFATRPRPRMFEPSCNICSGAEQPRPTSR